METIAYKIFKGFILWIDSFNIRPESVYTISFYDKLRHTKKKYLLSLLHVYYCRPTFKYWAFVFRPICPQDISEKKSNIALSIISQLPSELVDHICDFIPRVDTFEWYNCHVSNSHTSTSISNLAATTAAINFMLILGGASLLRYEDFD